MELCQSQTFPHSKPAKTVATNEMGPAKIICSCPSSNQYEIFVKATVYIYEFHKDWVKIDGAMVVKNLGSLLPGQPKCSSNLPEMLVSSLPYQRHAPDKIWLRYALRLQRYDSSKLLTRDNGRQKTDRLPTYELPCSPGPGELKRINSIAFLNKTSNTKFSI